MGREAFNFSHHTRRERKTFTRTLVAAVVGPPLLQCFGNNKLTTIWCAGASLPRECRRVDGSSSSSKSLTKSFRDQ